MSHWLNGGKENDIQVLGVGVSQKEAAVELSKAVPNAAKARNLVFVDATCPLVSKVHIEAERHHKNGLQIVMIGHRGHPETIGTMGQLP